LYGDFIEITRVVQMFMLGPRFILAIRERYAEMAANSDAGTHTQRANPGAICVL